MRAPLLCLALAACTPEIVAGAYLCGPESACPEGQACDGVDDTCVLASMARPFSCITDTPTEPDDTADEGALIEDLSCVSAMVSIPNCMLEGDGADWVTFVAPADCTALAVQARVSFPTAYEDLGLELWDIDADMALGTSEECKQGAGNGESQHCLDIEIVPGGTYGVRVLPSGDGTCDGECAYNRYTLSMQLATP